MEKISLVIITLNEEKNIEKCILSAPFADEVIVVDSGSTDQTEAIAKRCKARFIFNSWPGYGVQKQFAIDQAKNDWVLLLDADEYLDEELKNEIKNLLSSGLAFDAYTLPRKQIFMNKECHFGKSVDHPLRLCNRKKGHYDLKNIHESFVTSGSIGELKGHMIHNSAVNVLDRCKKICRDLELELINNHNPNVGIKNIVLDPVRYFLSYYIKQQGFRDGLAGYVLTALFAIQMFLLNAAQFEKNLSIKNKKK